MVNVTVDGVLYPNVSVDDEFITHVLTEYKPYTIIVEYGGNENFVGWDLIGYPGVRTVVTPAEQKLLSPPTRVRKSAYDTPMFNKAIVHVKPAGSDRDAD